MSQSSRFLFNAVFATAVGAACYFTLQWTRDPLQFPLRHIEVKGSLERVSRQEILPMVRKNAAHGFLWLDISEIRQKISRLPWVLDVSLKRKQMDTLVIYIQEKTVLARWGEQGLLSEQGEVFYPSSTLRFSHFPLFLGFEAQSQEFFSMHAAFLEALSPIGLQITQLEKDDQGSWKVVLDNQIEVILGRLSPLARLQRFVKLYQRTLFESERQIKAVDVRYMRGIAVRWKGK